MGFFDAFLSFFWDMTEPSPESKKKVVAARKRYDGIIQREAMRHKIPFNLLKAQIYHESAFDPKARSPVGAMGLMQIMPRTAEDLGLENPWDPEQNVAAGAKYLAVLWKMYRREVGLERWKYALASYNGGALYVLEAQKLAREAGVSPDRWVLISPFLKDVYVNGKRPDWQQIVTYVDRIMTSYADFTIEHQTGGVYHRLLDT